MSLITIYGVPGSPYVRMSIVREIFYRIPAGILALVYCSPLLYWLNQLDEILQSSSFSLGYGLPAFALPMILITFYLSLSGRFPLHRKLARFTYPVWLYVSVTGVIVYAMLAVYR